MAEKNYDKARAYKSSSVNKSDIDAGSFNTRKTKKYAKKIWKSPLLLIIAITTIVGLVGGFFLTKFTSKFEMNKFYVAGVEVGEVDYVEVDVSAHKEALEQTAGGSVTTEQVYATLGLTDKGVTIKFLGMDISNTLQTRYLYREDITHDVQEVDKIDVSVAGVYYIEYTSSHFAYKKVSLVRTIIVTGVEVDG